MQPAAPLEATLMSSLGLLLHLVLPTVVHAGLATTVPRQQVVCLVQQVATLLQLRRLLLQHARCAQKGHTLPLALRCVISVKPATTAHLECALFATQELILPLEIRLANRVMQESIIAWLAPVHVYWPTLAILLHKISLLHRLLVKRAFLVSFRAQLVVWFVKQARTRPLAHQ